MSLLIQWRVWGEHVVCLGGNVDANTHFNHIKGECESIFLPLLNCDPAVTRISFEHHEQIRAIHHHEWKRKWHTNGLGFGCGVQNSTPSSPPTKRVWRRRSTRQSKDGPIHLPDSHTAGYGSHAIRDIRASSPAKATQSTSKEDRWWWWWRWRWRRRLKRETHIFGEGRHEIRPQVWLHDEPVSSTLGICSTTRYQRVRPETSIWFTLTGRQFSRADEMATRRMDGVIQREHENVHPSSKRSIPFTDRLY